MSACCKILPKVETHGDIRISTCRICGHRHIKITLDPGKMLSKGVTIGPA